MNQKQVLTAKSNLPNTTVTTLLTSEEVCSLLRISSRTLQSYRDRNILPFSQIGRKIYYKAFDINEYLERHYIKARYQEGGSV
ncbi:MAG: helix-turn-helix domain-containing protein [Candidatus Heimdallarchaeaceae archaeon]